MNTATNFETSSGHPANIVAHLAKVSNHLLGTAESAETAADLFQQYLEVFTARECQSDFTPLEDLKYPSSYRELEEIGLLVQLVDDHGKPSAYLLDMLADDKG